MTIPSHTGLLVLCPAHACLPARNVSPRERVGSRNKTNRSLQGYWATSILDSDSSSPAMTWDLGMRLAAQCER